MQTTVHLGPKHIDLRAFLSRKSPRLFTFAKTIKIIAVISIHPDGATTCSTCVKLIRLVYNRIPCFQAVGLIGFLILARPRPVSPSQG